MENLTGIQYVEINGIKYEINGDVFSVEDVKAAAQEIDPSTANATLITDGDTIKFQRQAGTKGAEIVRVSYNGMEFEPQTANPDPKDVKDAMVEAYPELANADYSISTEGVMTFRLQAGTKGF